MTSFRVRSLALTLTAALAVVGSAGLAQAQETTAAPARGGIGAGYAAMLGGVNGLNLIYDAGRWHADGILGIAGGDDATALDLGVRGWFHLHSSTAADFSLGGGLGIAYFSPDGPPESTTEIFIEVGAKIRAFITSNVALSAFGGLAVATGDADGVLLSGQPVGGLGIAYYFW